MLTHAATFRNISILGLFTHAVAMPKMKAKGTVQQTTFMPHLWIPTTIKLNSRRWAGSDVHVWAGDISIRTWQEGQFLFGANILIMYLIFRKFMRQTMLR